MESRPNIRLDYYSIQEAVEMLGIGERAFLQLALDKKINIYVYLIHCGNFDPSNPRVLNVLPEGYYSVPRRELSLFDSLFSGDEGFDGVQLQSALNSSGKLVYFANNYKVRKTDLRIKNEEIDVLYRDKPEGRKKVEKSPGVMREQEKQILTCIRQLGYIPNKLPKRGQSKPWVKKEVRDELQGAGLFGSAKVFDNAWERLRGFKDIAEDHSPP